MRSIIAGLVGGVSGGAMVLAAGIVGFGANMEQRELPCAVAQEGGDDPIAPTILPRQRDDVTLDHHDPVMEIDLVGLPAIDAPPSASVIGSTIEPRLAQALVPDPEPGTMATPHASPADPALEEAVATADPVHDAVTEDTMATPAKPVDSAAAAVPEPAEVVPAQPTPPPPAHVFRLHVPKDLPKVDLGFSPTIEPVVVSDSAAARRSSRPGPPSPTASAAPPSRVVPAPSVRASAATARSASRIAQPTPAHNNEAGQTQDPNQSAQESLQRASDAVKRLSRRMGGRFGR